MKTNLLILFLAASLNAYGADKASFEAPLNTRAEGMGETGMIFGKEHGALYFSPAAVLYSKKLVTGGLTGNWYLLKDLDKEISTFKGNGAFYLKISNFVLGPGIEQGLSTNSNTGKGGVSIYIPIAFGFEIGDFSVGVGAKYLAVAGGFFSEDNQVIRGFDGFTSDIGGSYRTSIGYFSIAINNLLSSGSSENESANLMRNLKIGYAKEFEVGYLIDSIKTAVELDNLLMEDFYLNTNGQGDYAWFRKLRIGSELSANLAEIIYFDGRIGLKNFFPTLGLTISIGRIFTLDYAFTNHDFGREWGKDRVLLNSFSLSIGSF